MYVWGSFRQLCKYLIFWLLAPLPSTKQTFLQPYKLVKRGKKRFKSFLHSNKWLFFPSSLFIWLRFESHQTLYMSISLAHNVNTFNMFMICEQYFEKWFYAMLVWVMLILSTELGIWVFCHSANHETAKPGWITRLEKYSLL